MLPHMRGLDTKLLNRNPDTLMHDVMDEARIPPVLNHFVVGPDTRLIYE